jgi:predicted PurR-regulated permease PerM
MVRKGQSLSIDIIIIIVIGLVVLVFVVLFFTGTFSKGITGTNNVINPALNQTNQTGQLINSLPSQINEGSSSSSTSTTTSNTQSTTTSSTTTSSSTSPSFV